LIDERSNAVRLSTAILVAALFVAPAYAQHSQGSRDTQHPSAALSDGEVRKVDKDAKKITIKHGPLANLDMPPMTMVFQVKDPALLNQVKAGDRVRFQAEKIGGAYTVTKIEPVK
jgi:Cu(I)/Ag(I) efflux system periplasmic protein CusF